MIIVFTVLPFLIFLIIGGFGRHVGRIGAAVVGLLGMAVTVSGFWYLVLNQGGVSWVGAVVRVRILKINKFTKLVKEIKKHVYYP